MDEGDCGFIAFIDKVNHIQCVVLTRHIQEGCITRGHLQLLDSRLHLYPLDHLMQLEVPNKQIR